MAELNEPTGEADPFGPELAPGLSLIVLMRLYDVGLALLTEMNRESASFLINKHAESKILGPLPGLNMSESDQLDEDDSTAPE